MNMKDTQVVLFEKRKRFRTVVFLLCFVSVVFSCVPIKIRTVAPPSGLRAHVVSTSIDLLGNTYRAGGRGPDYFDCSGLVSYVYKKVGLSLAPTAEEQGRSGIEVSLNSVLPGDLVVFRIKGDFHVGIMVNEREFIHASKSRGVAVDNLTLPYWMKNLLGFRSVL